MNEQNIHVVNNTFKSIEKYFLLMEMDTVNGWYTMEIGLPKGWIYKSNDLIDCEVTLKNDVGFILKILPKKDNITIDDLIRFVSVIVETNSKITEVYEQFKEEVAQKGKMISDMIDQLKEKSFEIFDDKANELKNKKEPTNNKSTKTKSIKRGRPRKKELDDEKSEGNT